MCVDRTVYKKKKKGNYSNLNQSETSSAYNMSLQLHRETQLLNRSREKNGPPDSESCDQFVGIRSSVKFPLLHSARHALQFSVAVQRNQASCCRGNRTLSKENIPRKTEEKHTRSPSFPKESMFDCYGHQPLPSAFVNPAYGFSNTVFSYNKFLENLRIRGCALGNRRRRRFNISKVIFFYKERTKTSKHLTTQNLSSFTSSTFSYEPDYRTNTYQLDE